MSNPLDFYSQVAKGEPADSYLPSDEKQLIDLTEFHQETKQGETTVMISGIEEMRRGVLSRETAVYLNLPGVANYDPFPSDRNARAGQEGFFSAIKDGFKTFIENIIKYVRMVIDWVVNGIKTIFGFRKSTRITKEINKELDNLKGEFSSTLQGLGFPSSEYNLQNYLGKLPPGQDRLPQLTLLKDKLTSDLDNINGLTASLPLFQKAIQQLNRTSEKTVRQAAVLKRAISQEYTKTRVRAGNPNLRVLPSGSTELLVLVKAMAEVRACMQTSEVAETVQALLKELHGHEFSNEELTNGFAGTKKKLQETLDAHQVNLRIVNAEELMVAIQILNARYIEISDNEIDLRQVNMKELGQTIDKDDMTKVSEISGYYTSISEKWGDVKDATGQDLLIGYKELTVDLRNFTQFCFNVSQSLLVTERQIKALIDWHNRANTYYAAAVVNDIETITKTIEEARKAGHTPYADTDGYPTGMVIISEADAKTFAEKASANVKGYYDRDLAGVKTSLGAFQKQIGWGI